VLFLGLDIATSTGICWMDTRQQPKDWRVLAAISEGDFREDESSDLGRFIYQEVLKRPPDFVSIEMPRRDMELHGKKERDPDTGEMVSSGKTTINPNAIKLTGLAAGVVTALDIADIPWGLIAPVTWRNSYFGKAFEPPTVFDKSKRKFVPNWKLAAVQRAELQGIRPPVDMTKKAWEDTAEAIGIASAWSACTKIPKRHQAAFVALRTRDRRIAA